MKWKPVITTLIGCTVAFWAILTLMPADTLYHLLPGKSYDALKQYHFARRLQGTYVRRLNSARPGAVIFLGASTLHGMQTHDIVADSINLAMSGETSSGLRDRLAAYTFNAPSRFVVQTGFNDFSRVTNTQTQKNVAGILAALTPIAPVVLLGYHDMPFLRSPSAANIRQHIQFLNKTLKEACQHTDECLYVSYTPLGHDGQEQLRKEEFEPDGIHLSAKGYHRLARKLGQILQ